MRNAFVLALVACGGTHDQVQTVRPPDVRPVTPETVCARFSQLVKQECGAFANLMTPKQCPEVFRQALDAPTTKDGRVLSQMGRCMVDHEKCDAVSMCLATIKFDDPTDLRACSDHPDSRAVGVPQDAFDRRTGAEVTQFAEAVSSKAQPIETCGVSAGLDWLVRATCNDGSQPIANHEDAEKSRTGNVGPGGRCNSVIDLYRISCPEKTYDVYVDSYVCPLP